MKTFGEFVNEGVRTMMTPKSKSDIRELLDNDNNLVNRVKYIMDNDLQYLYTEEELKELIERAIEFMTFAEQSKFAIRYCFVWIIEDILKEGYYDYPSITKTALNDVRTINSADEEFEFEGYEERVKIRNKIAELIKERNKRFKKKDIKLIESVRDKMTPVSDEDIRNRLKGLSSDDILQVMYKGPNDELLYDYFTDDEVMKMLGNLRYDRKGIFLRAALGYRDYKFTKMLLDAGADPNLDDCWPMKYMVNWKEKELADLLKSYGGVLKPEDIVIKESVRDMMTPKSPDEIEKALDDLYKRSETESISGDMNNKLYTMLATRWLQGDKERRKELEEKYPRYKVFFDSFRQGLTGRRTNESLRDKMSPVSNDFINDKINNSTQEEIMDILYRTIASNDTDTVELVLPHVDLKTGGKELYDLCEFSVDLGHLKILDILIKKITNKGIIKKVIDYMEDYIDDAYITKPAKERVISFIEKYKNLIKENFAGDENMTFVNNLNIKRYNEIGLKNFQRSFSDFVNSRIDEGVRDKMTPKSDEDILKSLSHMSREQKMDYLGQLLRKACANHDTDEIEELLDWGADPNSSFDDTMSPSIWNPLMFCIWAENPEGVELVLKHGAKVKSYHYEELNKPEWYKKEEKKEQILRLLNRYSFKGKFKKFLGMNEGIRDKMTPKTTDVIKNKLKDMPLDRALEKVRDQGLKVLDYFSTDEIKEYMWDKSKEEVLLMSSELGIIEFVQNMLEHGVDVNTKDSNGWTGLMWASSFEHMDILKMLIEWGADVNIGDVNGDTALMDAAEWGLIDVVEFLIKNGADVNQSTHEGYTALMSACMKGNTDVAEVLIRNGADINAKDKWNFTALSLATEEGHDETVSLLKKHGAK